MHRSIVDANRVIVKRSMLLFSIVRFFDFPSMLFSIVRLFDCSIVRGVVRLNEGTTKQKKTCRGDAHRRYGPSASFT